MFLQTSFQQDTPLFSTTPYTTFNYSSQIECYVPAAKRQYGYYTLPILYGDTFVARLDAKADRKSNLLTINNIWFEKGFKQTKVFNNELDKEITRFAQFCGCEDIKKGA